MIITFNPDSIISDFADGKIITDVISHERYFISDNAYNIISRAIGKSVSVDELYTETYSRKDFDAFISELIELNIVVEV
ncbi:hypothetical protein [Paenibacillus sp. KN14-4R]|uniref:hypothetical protein n=1 Tax=Paenibacillus sp. KN14-4R TaxID=3445773 RepID=UPI003FA19104